MGPNFSDFLPSLGGSLSRDTRRAEAGRAPGVSPPPAAASDQGAGPRESRADLRTARLWRRFSRARGLCRLSAPGSGCGFRSPRPLPRPRALPSRRRRDPWPPPPSPRVIALLMWPIALSFPLGGRQGWGSPPPPRALPRAGSPPSLPSDHQPGAHDLRSHDQGLRARRTSPTGSGQAPLCRRYLFKEFFFF